MSLSPVETIDNYYNIQLNIRKQINLNIIKDILIGVNSPIDFKTFYKKINKESISIKSNKGYKSFLNIDLTYLFKNTTIDTIFECFFIKENFAWISQKNNHYRYFSKSYNGNLISLDLIDIASLYYDSDNPIGTLNILASNINLVSIEDYWKDAQINKYNSNTKFLEEFDIIKNDYPSLYKFIYPHRDILKCLNEISFNNIFFKNMSIDKESLFFISTGYLADLLKISQGKVSKVINFLCLLGVIMKAPQSQIPQDMLNKSRRIAKERGVKDIVNYYYIINLENNLDNLEMKSQLVKKTPIRYSNITKNIIEKYLGKETSHLVYPN